MGWVQRLVLVHTGQLFFKRVFFHPVMEIKAGLRAPADVED